MSSAVTEQKLDPAVVAELDNANLAAVLRKATWGSHANAEFSDFEQALVKGKLEKDAYVEMLAQTYFVYQALEAGTEKLADDPVGGAVNFPELARSEAVERDLAFYRGDNWRAETKPLSITAEYVARIEQMVEESPAGFVAHHYTRYLADLSGGVHIDKAIKEAYGLDEDGRRVYLFDIADWVEFKNNYRSVLDDLPLDRDGKVRLIEEALVAYQFNIKLIEELTRLIPDFEVAS